MDADRDDEAAIQRLIEAETAAFWNKDYEAWASCWVHEPFVRRWGWWAARGGMTVRDGWDENARRMRQLMSDNPAVNASAGAVRRENLVIRVKGDMAWASFDQVAPATGDVMDVAGLTHELRILERDDGVWRIACLFFLQRSLDHLRVAAVRVDADGRILWRNDAAVEALKTSQTLVEREGRLRALDRTADMSLRTAIRHAARLDDGLYPMRSAMPIVLDWGHRVPADVCWVIGESGDILISFNDERMMEMRLDAAAVVFGVTPTQLRVAKLIVGGSDIVDAARQLGISVTTARTHLQRMYDRTGVHSQAGLVRTLLSTAQPPL